MSEPARVKIEIDCPSIEVRRGEFATVWLRVDDGSGFDRIQCELRVEKDGTPRVFLPPRHTGIVDSFDNWTPDAAPSRSEGTGDARRCACHDDGEPDDRGRCQTCLLPRAPAAPQTTPQVRLHTGVTVTPDELAAMWQGRPAPAAPQTTPEPCAYCINDGPDPDVTARERMTLGLPQRGECCAWSRLSTEGDR